MDSVPGQGARARCVHARIGAGEQVEDRVMPAAAAGVLIAGSSARPSAATGADTRHIALAFASLTARDLHAR
ncbi:MAG: hypothetical protein HY801_03110 [Candidatus Lindowbacteria bacterium]|nr:hypothetical protein [Candidatus Lindowbacteria bacterium]